MKLDLELDGIFKINATVHYALPFSLANYCSGFCYYQIYHNGRHTQKAKPVLGVSHKKEHYNYKNTQQTNNYKTAQQYKNIN